MTRKEQRREEYRLLKEQNPDEYRRQRDMANRANREYHRKLMETNPEKVREKGKMAARRRYARPEGRKRVLENACRYAKKRKEWFQELKSTLSCEECGMSHPAAIMFHHRDGDEKDSCVSIMVAHTCCPKEEVLEEIKKCAILCQNCHSVFHYIYGVKDFPVYEKGMIMKNGVYLQRPKSLDKLSNCS